MEKRKFIKSHWKHIVIWTVILSVIVVALRYGIDKKAVVFGTVLIGVFTQAFAGLAALVGALPYKRHTLDWSLYSESLCTAYHLDHSCQRIFGGGRSN